MPGSRLALMKKSFGGTLVATLTLVALLACGGGGGTGGGGPIGPVGPITGVGDVSASPARTTAPPLTSAPTAAPTAAPAVVTTPAPLNLVLALAWIHGTGQSQVCYGLQGPLALLGANVTGTITGPGVVGQGTTTATLDPTGKAKGTFTINQFGTYSTAFTATLGGQTTRATGQINVVAGNAPTACAQ